MFKPPYAEDRTYGGVRGSGETIVSHSLLDLTKTFQNYALIKKVFIRRIQFFHRFFQNSWCRPNKCRIDIHFHRKAFCLYRHNRQ